MVLLIATRLQEAEGNFRIQILHTIVTEGYQSSDVLLAFKLVVVRSDLEIRLFVRGAAKS